MRDLVKPADPAASYVLMTFYPQINFGLPAGAERPTDGFLGIYPQDRVDAVNQCSAGHTIHNVAGYFSSGFNGVMGDLNPGAPIANAVDYHGQPVTIDGTHEITDEHSHTHFTVTLTPSG